MMKKQEDPKVRPKIVWCDPCNGDGWCFVEVEKEGKREKVPFECMCGHLKRVGAGMQHYIKSANVEKEHVRLPLLTMAKESLYVEATWSDMRAIIKILLMTGTNGHVMDVDEMQLRDAYVGSMSKASKSADYNGVIYNNISELVGPADLLIVRLNTLSNKNKAMAGVLLEAVKLRVDYGKPTWVLSDHERPFNQTCHSYSDEVLSIFAEQFKKVVVPRINKADREVARDFLSSSLDLERSQQSEPAARRPAAPDVPRESLSRKRREPVPDTEPDNPMSMYGSGVKQSKTKFRKG